MKRPYKQRAKIPPETRFWEKVEKTESCWNWKGYLNTSGYGHFQLGRPFGVIRAPRFSWELHKGPIPKGTWILHKCDNRACVNPEHLFVGNGKDNYWDMVNKGRQNFVKGETHPRHKLTEEQVRDIRANLVPWSRVKGARFFARKYNISHGVICGIMSRKYWKHVT